MKLQKTLHSLWDTQYNGVLARDCFISGIAPAVGDLPSVRGFLLGLNFDMLRGNSDHILSGMDLSKATSYIEANFTTAISRLCTVDSYIYHDMLLIVDQLGNLTSKF